MQRYSSTRMTLFDSRGLEKRVAGNKTRAAGVVCIVADEGVCLQQRSGELARAPRHVIPGRGLQSSNGQWGSFRPANRPPLGAALLVPCRPRDRMGLRGPSRKHARYQRERDVYRSRGPAVGGRRIYRATGSRTPGKARLLGEANRAGARHGRVCLGPRIRKPEAFRGPAFLSLQHRPLIPFYTKANDTLP
jgi:hypothetical protein